MKKILLALGLVALACGCMCCSPGDGVVEDASTSTYTPTTALILQEDIQQQAARLVAREEELQSQGADLSNLARRWQTEQLGYQQEIRRLRGQLRQQEEPVGVS